MMLSSIYRVRIVGTLPMISAVTSGIAPTARFADTSFSAIVDGS
jgi:hypothetical protein